MQNMLVLRNVSISFSNFQLKDINFEVKKGEIVGLIGENGAGKTTLFKIILNQILFESGEVLLSGSPVSVTSKEKIGVIFDRNHFNGYLNAVDIDKIYQHIFRDWDSTIFFEYIRKFSIPRNQEINKLSQGMKVKLNFAFVFAHSPELLLFDEATNGLDPVVRNEILEIIKAYVTATNGTVLIASHILEDIEKICNKIVYLKNGQVILSDRIEDIDSSIEDLMISKNSEVNI